jgi:hypothetical protein
VDVHNVNLEIDPSSSPQHCSVGGSAHGVLEARQRRTEHRGGLPGTAEGATTRGPRGGRARRRTERRGGRRGAGCGGGACRRTERRGGLRGTGRRGGRTGAGGFDQRGGLRGAAEGAARGLRGTAEGGARGLRNAAEGGERRGEQRGLRRAGGGGGGARRGRGERMQWNTEV